MVQITINADLPFTGARFSAAASDNFYGVWEYPWNSNLENDGVEFDLKGLGDSEGINWSNARAPFFFTTAGYGVYADTLARGSVNFSQPGTAQFIFNSVCILFLEYLLTYTCILIACNLVQSGVLRYLPGYTRRL